MGEGEPPSPLGALFMETIISIVGKRKWVKKMTSTNKLLNRAYLLSNKGNHKDARKLLLAVLDQDPQNGRALLLYLDTFETREERAKGLEFLFRKHKPLNGPSN